MPMIVFLLLFALFAIMETVLKRKFATSSYSCTIPHSKAYDEVKIIILMLTLKFSW